MTFSKNLLMIKHSLTKINHLIQKNKIKMSLFNTIGLQMNEFNSSTLSIENKFDLIFIVAKDMINDFNAGQT